MVYHDDDELDEEAAASAGADGSSETALDEEEPLDEEDAPGPRDSQAPESYEAGRASRRRRLERMLPEAFKRAIEKGLEAGIGTLTSTSESIRGVVGKTDLPKDVASYVFSQVDDTRNAMVRVVAREVREFLEAADLAKELQRALTSLSFEIRTEIRFIPNDKGGVTPDVKARVGPRRGERRPATRRPSAPRLDEDDESDPHGHDDE